MVRQIKPKSLTAVHGDPPVVCPKTTLNLQQCKLLVYADDAALYIGTFSLTLLQLHIHFNTVQFLSESC